jgi:protein-tyrosine kinase
MSRIEQALEKAARLRGDEVRSGYAQRDYANSKKCDPAVFEVAQGGVDTAAVERRIVTVTDPNSLAAEEYKKLRARILQTTEKNFQNAIMVTSAQAGEGKSVTAINLAISIAQELDHTVLLIDADLRRPSIHTYLGLQASPGLSDYLISNTPLSNILIKTGLGKLVFMPAGAVPANPSELLGSDRMREFVREVKERYPDRYVIFDTPPMLMAADAISLADYADGVLFVIQAGRTTQKLAGEALALLKNCNVLGAVFNNVPEHFTRKMDPYYQYRHEVKVQTADQAGVIE